MPKPANYFLIVINKNKRDSYQRVKSGPRACHTAPQWPHYSVYLRPHFIPLGLQLSTSFFRNITLLPAIAVICIASCQNETPANDNTQVAQPARDSSIAYKLPDTAAIPHDPMGEMIRYGRELVMNTSKHIGPKGSAGRYAGNMMNCAHCHLDGGTRPYAFNFFSTHARYPQYRGRENKVLTLEDRVNNCIERPLNGRPLGHESKEMIAIVSYIKWLSTNVPVGQHVKGDENLDISFPARAADPQKGAAIFAENCASCHGANGQGQLNIEETAYTYPPLWGPNSYQKGSSAHRITKLARFIKANMPDKKATWEKPFLTDEEALDVAAFINDDSIHPRPDKKPGTPDYPYAKAKPIDFGTGPFEDSFSAQQHKYGPFTPIVEYHKAHGLPAIY